MQRSKWTADQIRQLASRYPEEGLADLPALFNRSRYSVTSFARRMGLRSRNHYRHLAESRSIRKRAVAAEAAPGR